MKVKRWVALVFLGLLAWVVFIAFHTMLKVAS